MDARTAEDRQETVPGRERRMLVRRRLRVGIIGVLLGIAVGTWWFFSRSGPQAPAGRPGTAIAIPVGAATAETGDIDITLNELGTITSLATVTIRSQISGYLTQIVFTEGQIVKQGDLLAQIDSRPYELALSQAEGQLARDQALLADARLDLVRFQTLAKTNAIPKQQLDTQDALVKQDEGIVKSDQAMIGTAQLNITYCHIVAPVSGRVGLRQVDQGNYVTPTDANGIVVITQLQPITVLFTVPEDNVPQIVKRLHANAKLPATAYDRTGTMRIATGNLLTLDNQIDVTTGTLKLKAQFANDDERLFPNQFVNIRLLVDVLHDTTVVPTSAIQRGAPGTFVYLIKSDLTVAAQPVTIGPANGDRVSVKSGLAAGDRVVVDGADRLRDGAKVSLRNSATESVTAPAAASSPGPPR